MSNSMIPQHTNTKNKNKTGKSDAINCRYIIPAGEEEKSETVTAENHISRSIELMTSGFAALSHTLTPFSN